MTLQEELERIAAAASTHGEVTGVLAAEPAGEGRVYLVALGEGESQRWLLLDAAGTPVARRAAVRGAASIVAMCELAGDVAGGGDLQGLRTHLEELRAADGADAELDAVEEAACELPRAVGEPPRVATPAYLDAVGEATLAHGRGRRVRPRGRARLRGASRLTATLAGVEGGMGFPFGGDPEDLLRGLREFAEQQAESVQEAQREQFATLTLNTAVELTAAALSQMQVAGGPDEQALALRDAMRVLFPEAVALVSAARQGFMREQ